MSDAIPRDYNQLVAMLESSPHRGISDALAESGLVALLRSMPAVDVEVAITETHPTCERNERRWRQRIKRIADRYNIEYDGRDLRRHAI